MFFYFSLIIFNTKKKNQTIEFNSGWIGSIGQSFGGLLAPFILLFARRYGFQISFVLSLVICVISLFFSSIIRNLHWLLLTYSLPYGFANASIFILGTLVCGLYYPAGQHPRHILVMCIISTGFPIGYHIMSAIIFSSIEENGWQLMKRRIAMIELLVTCVLGPFFTTKCLPNPAQGYQYPSTTLITDNNRKIYFSKPIIYWMLGIFSAMCAVNNFLLHLVCFT
jgi:MFS family permease